MSFMVAVSVIAIACAGKKRNQATNQDEKVAVDSTALDLMATAGTYEGIIPLADGPGEKVVVTINADSTYSWTSDAEGKERFHDEASGVFEVLPGKVLMLIRPSSNEHTFYKVKGENELMMTDSLGNEPDKSMAELYVLTKKK